MSKRPNGTSATPCSQSKPSPSLSPTIRSVRAQLFATRFEILRDGTAARDEPLARIESPNSGQESREDIGDVVIPPVDRRDAHAHEKRQAHPKQPAAVAPGRENRHHRAGDMRRRKRGTMHAAEALDQADEVSR